MLIRDSKYLTTQSENYEHLFVACGAYNSRSAIQAALGMGVLEYAFLFTQAEVTAFQDECTRDLAVAEPVILEAEAALNSLDKASLGELKSFGSPAADVVAVVSACMILTAPGGKIPKVRTPKGLHGHFTQSCANIVHN